MLRTNVMYLTAFTDIKIPTFWEKWRDEAVDHEMDFKKEVDYQFSVAIHHDAWKSTIQVIFW